MTVDGLAAAAGDDAGHVRAVAVGVHQGVGRIAKDARAQIRVRGIHARVVDVDQHVGAGQAEVVVRGQRDRWPRRSARGSDHWPAARRSAHSTSCTPGNPATAGKLSAGGTHPEHRPKRGTFRVADDPGPKLLQVRAGRLARIGKEQHVERAVVGQGILRHRQFQQRRLELVVGLVGQNGLRLRVGLNCCATAAEARTR